MSTNGTTRVQSIIQTASTLIRSQLHKGNLKDPNSRLVLQHLLTAHKEDPMSTIPLTRSRIQKCRFHSQLHEKCRHKEEMMLNGFLYSCEYLKWEVAFLWIPSLWRMIHWMVIRRTTRHSIDLSSELIKSTHAQQGIKLRQYLFAKDEEEKNPLKENKWNVQENY
jgi:hypothetical protein